MITLSNSTLLGPASRAGGTVPTPTSSAVLAGAPARAAVFSRATVGEITCFTPRGKRFVDYMACPLCKAPRVGIEYHGELLSGAKVHELAKHSPGRANRRGQLPACDASKIRVVFENGDWRAQ